MRNICKSNTQKREIFYGIDVFKLLFAVLIVFTHTYCYDLGSVGNWIQNTLASAGVPFFFIVSGFFYTRGLQKTSNPRDYFFRYFKRMFKLYLVWTVISLPVFGKVIELAHGDYSTGLKIVYLIRSIIFSGTTGVYWYILSLLYISVILYFVYKHRKLESVLYIVAVICFCGGVVYTMGNPDRNPIFHLIHVVFGSERNFITVGLLYTSIGYYFALYGRKNQNVGFSISMLICAIILKTIETTYFDVHIMQIFVAVAAFLLAVNLQCDFCKKYCKNIRNLSTAIYLEHFLIILIFDFYLKRGTWIDFSVTLLSSILIYEIVKFIFPQKFSKIIFGA